MNVMDVSGIIIAEWTCAGKPNSKRLKASHVAMVTTYRVLNFLGSVDGCNGHVASKVKLKSTITKYKNFS